MMQDVPWHSVDSASWIMVASYGHIWWPKSMRVVSISSDSPNKHLADKHFVNISELEREEFARFAEKYGMTTAQLEGDFVYRAIWNRLVMSEIYRAVPDDVVKPLQEGLFGL